MTDEEDDKRQIDLIEYIEDAERAGPAALNETYSDEQLDSAGLIAVKAFVRSKASKNAERVRRNKERREKGEIGPARKQLNLQAPVDDNAREILKELNTAMLEEALTPEDVRAVLTEESLDWKQRCIDAENQLDQAHRQIDELTAKIKRHRLDWLGWPLKYIFGRR
jgi:hypothetical protein